MSEHTPEPWRVSAEVEVEEHGARVDTFAICAGVDDWIAVLPPGDNSKVDEANARRIVACVNACEGVTTETLERVPEGSGIVRGAFSAVAKIYTAEEIAEQDRVMDETMRELDEQSNAVKRLATAEGLLREADNFFPADYQNLTALSRKIRVLNDVASRYARDALNIFESKEA